VGNGCVKDREVKCFSTIQRKTPLVLTLFEIIQMLEVLKDNIIIMFGGYVCQKQSVFLLVPTESLFSPTCSLILMRRNVATYRWKVHNGKIDIHVLSFVVLLRSSSILSVNF
jgi:hypothetical protein